MKTHFETANEVLDMVPTRRAFLGMTVAALGGCISDPGADCSGATVRLSLRPTTDKPPHRLDSATLSSEAVGVLETAIEDEHVEHCVAWDPADDETGPSPGLAEIGDWIEIETDVELSDRTDPVRIEIRYDGRTYRLQLVTERSD